MLMTISFAFRAKLKSLTSYEGRPSVLSTNGAKPHHLVDIIGRKRHITSGSLSVNQGLPNTKLFLGQVENAEVRKPKYENGSTETEIRK